MAEEISNKTLAVIVVAAIVVTLGSTALIMRMGAPVITGMVTTQTGTAQFNITGVVSIAINDAIIDFGAGSVVSPNDWALLDTDGTVTQGNWSATNDGFKIENDGNVNIDVTVKSDKLAATFIGGTSPSFKWEVDESEAESVTCTNTNMDTYVEATLTDQAFCSTLAFGDSADEVLLNLQVTIPNDATPGGKTAQMTFSAVASA